MKDLQLNQDVKLSLGLWLRLMRCARTIERGMEGRLRRDYKQSMSRFDVLSQLERSKEKWLSVGDLASRLLASNGNITGLLDRMLHEGLIARRPSPADRRSHQICISPKGRRLFARMASDHAEWTHSVLGELPFAEREQLEGLLDKLRIAVDTPAPQVR